MTSENNVQGGNARRIEGLDILRGLAILMVVFSHFVPETFKSLNGGFISSWGGGGVLLFFLSQRFPDLSECADSASGSLSSAQVLQIVSGLLD